MKDLDRPIGILGKGPFAQALAAAVGRAGRSTRTCGGLDDAGALATLTQDSIVIFLAVHADELIAVATALGKLCDGRHVLVHPLRGLVGDALVPTSVVLRERTPVHKIGALGGPLVASALSANRPSGGIVGSRFAEVTASVRHALVSPTLRIYATDDLVGVELAACLIGTLAMGAGFARAIGVGPSATGVLLTRGVHEAAAIAELWGARRDTFHGLAGFGDLMAAVGDDDRPEVQVGRMLGGGMGLANVASAVGGHPESIRIGVAVARKAAKAGIDTPIFHALGEIASGRPASEVIGELMGHERVYE